MHGIHHGLDYVYLVKSVKGGHTVSLRSKF